MRLNYTIVSLLFLSLVAGLGQGFGQVASQVDTVFSRPYIDVDQWRDTPVRHRYIHGGFHGNDTRFSFYFPAEGQYQGRFFQYITPFPDNENLSQGGKGEEDKISFAIASGAYFIETNGGGRTDFGKPGISNDPTIGAFRANAASAAYSRQLAEQMYGKGRPYGYAFGGSGGAYRTIGGIENTTAVWDGVVPYVVGSPVAIPNVFTVRMHAMRILQDKLPGVIDALEPGGSGDMYAGLNDEQQQALREVTRMGFPPRSWFGYKTMGIHGFLVLYQGVVMADRKYFTEDFWKTPGYLGAGPTASLLKARIQHATSIKAAINSDEAVGMGLTEHLSAQERGTAEAAWKSMTGREGGMPVAYHLESAPPATQFLGGDLIIKSGAAAGKALQLTKINGDKVVLGPSDATVLAQLAPGDQVQVDNSNFLAVQTYHRHQDPGEQYPVWDLFRNDQGKPLYPQRPMLLGPMFTRGASGGVPTGKFTGKMILLSSLWDREAFPWQADWYRARVTEFLGDSTDSHFRLWYTDRALHGDLNKQEDPTQTVSYLGVLQQALRDLSTWVEKGIAPPATTTYKIQDGQVIVPERASARKGIQPTIVLRANGSKSVRVAAGQTVTFTAEVELPAHTGKIVAAEWDFEGEGTFAQQSKLGDRDSKTGLVKVSTKHSFKKAGTYFPTLRAVSQRQGDASTPFTRVANLDRVRVVVR